MERWTFMIAFAVLLVACGDDDDDAASTCGNACDGGTRDGAVPSGGTGGSRAGAGGGGSGTSGRGASGGSGPAADASTGDPDPIDGDGGDADGSTAGPDAGMDPEPPMTGDQLSVCGEPSDCSMGLGCYELGPGQGFCTRTCESDKDCKSIAGAEYTCSDEGLCEVDCGKRPEADNCPEGLVCSEISGPGAGGISNRCTYP
jgi:hypothetical protein